MKRLAMMLGLDDAGAGDGLMLVISDAPTGRFRARQGCLVNSDCDSPLLWCGFGKCHRTCTRPVTAIPGQDCVRGADGDVCLLGPGMNAA